MLFNPFSQAPLSYLDPFFEQLFIDIDNRAKRINELITSYKNIENPLRLSISGGRGYGKTTLLNAIVHEILRMTQDGIRLIPVYSKISGVAYIHEPDELIKRVYSQVLGDLYTLVNLSKSTLQKRVERYTRSMVPDVAKSAISFALTSINPFLTIVTPVARKVVDDVLEQYHAKRIEDLLINPSISKLHVLETVINECSEKEIKPIFIMDELDKAILDVLIRFFRSERRFFESYNRIIIVALSTGIGGIMSYSGGKIADLQRIFDAPSPISLMPITTLEDAERIVYARLQWASMDKKINPRKIFPLPVLERVLDISDGIPAPLMELCAKALDNAINEKSIYVDIKHLPFYAEEFKVMIEYFSLLPQTEKRVIKRALQQGLFASDRELQEKLSVSRSRLSQILRKFEKNGLVISRPRGREKLYYITDETKAKIEAILRFRPEIFEHVD